MKVALVYDYLNQRGGGERLLGMAARLFPEAPIYTLFHDRALFRDSFPGHPVISSPFDCALLRKKHRAFIPLLPLLARTLRIDPAYDTVLSFSAGYGKGIPVPRGSRHLSYCFTPLRYAWEPDLVPHAIRSRPALRALASPALAYLRRWDARAGQRPDRMVTLSHFIAGKIRSVYGRDAAVIYPPIDHERFFFDPAIPKGGYFVAAGRLVHYKRFDLVIDAFNALGLPLVVAGTGPEEARLKARAVSPAISFAGHVTDGELRRLYAGARAFIFPHIEDFGLVGAEAIACGTPLIALRAGGAAEIAEEGISGVFFETQSPDALIGAIRSFVAREGEFDPARIASSARRFSFDAFQGGIMANLAML